MYKRQLLSTDVAHLSTALEAPAWNLDSIYLVILGMNLVFWAFLGWENLSFATEEFVDIKKDFNKVIVISFLIMMFLYLGLSASVVALLDKESMQTVMVPLAAVAHEVLGSYSAYVVAGVAFLILLININAWVWGPSRLMYDSGRKKIIPEFFAKLNHNNACLLYTSRCV